MTGAKFARPGVLVETEWDKQRAKDGHLAWRGAEAVDRQVDRQEREWVTAQLSKLPGRTDGKKRRSVRERAEADHKRAGGVKNAEANRALSALVGVHKKLELLPWRWARHVEREHARRGGAGVKSANDYVNAAVDGADGALPWAASDSDLRALAESVSMRAREIVGGNFLSAGVVGARAALSKLWVLAEIYSVKKMDCECDEDIYPLIARYCCKRWWLRNLRRAHAQAAEGAAVKSGLVNRRLWMYATQDAVERRAEQRARNRKSVEEATMYCAETGEELSLADVVDGSLSSPDKKRGELMVRVKACDSIAFDRGYVCEFWTLTAPSRYHAMTIINDDVVVPNKHYEGKLPSHSQKWLCGVFARARAAWKRAGLDVFGMRTAEPHHDGTTHWHLVVYGEKNELRTARWMIKRIALKDSGWEPGARERRFNFKVADGLKGAAYAAKYASKNIDGKGLDGEVSDEDQQKISASVKRADAWAGHWRIRQFQFFGTPAVTPWRLLRKFSESVGDERAAIERARAAADRGDFADFWRVCDSSKLDVIYSDDGKKTVYGDDAPARPCGVAEGGRRAVLEKKTWVITWAGAKVPDEIKRIFAAKAQQSAGFGFSGFAGIARPWSCVNNCTRSDESGGVEKDEAGGLAGVFEREAGGVGWLVDKFF